LRRQCDRHICDSKASGSAVLRPKPALGPNPRGLCVADYAESLYGRAYSVPRAVMAPLESIDLPDTGAVFCSQVIAQAFKEYGLDLFPGTSPSKVRPWMLLECKQFENVTLRSVRVLGSISNRPLFEQVVATSDQELPGNEMKRNRKALNAIRKALGKKFPKQVSSLPEFWHWLAHNIDEAREVDVAVMEILRETRFIEWYDDFETRVADDAQLYEKLRRLAEKANAAPMTPDLQILIDQLGESLALGETSLLGRQDTLQQATRWEHDTKLATFGYFKDYYDANTRCSAAYAMLDFACSRRLRGRDRDSAYCEQLKEA